MPDLLLGVDGGNTKCIALVAHRDGTIVGAGRAGCSDIYAVDEPETALAEIDLAVASALASAGASTDDVEAAGFSLAGADWPEDYDLLRCELSRRLPHVPQLEVECSTVWRCPPSVRSTEPPPSAYTRCTALSEAKSGLPLFIICTTPRSNSP